jgi:hypothetical protein
MAKGVTERICWVLKSNIQIKLYEHDPPQTKARWVIPLFAGVSVLAKFFGGFTELPAPEGLETISISKWH